MYLLQYTSGFGVYPLWYSCNVFLSNEKKIISLNVMQSNIFPHFLVLTYSKTFVQYCLTKSIRWMGMLNLSQTNCASSQSCSLEQNPVSSTKSQFFKKMPCTSKPVDEFWNILIDFYRNLCKFSESSPFCFSIKPATAESTPPEIPTTTFRIISTGGFEKVNRFHCRFQNKTT